MTLAQSGWDYIYFVPILLAFAYLTLQSGDRALSLMIPGTLFFLMAYLWPARTEMGRYVMPAVPFFAVLSARGIERLASAAKGKTIRIAFYAIILSSFLAFSLHEGAWMMDINRPKYQGYLDAGEWINKNAPEGAVIVTNARAIWYYSDRESTYFPDTALGFIELAEESHPFVIIGGWPTAIPYPGYAHTLPKTHPQLQKEAVFNVAPREVTIYRFTPP